MLIEVAEITSPIGNIVVAVREGQLCALSFTDHWPQKRARLQRRFASAEFCDAASPAGVERRLTDYFAGDLDALESVAVDPGGTPFQSRVWTALRRVPAGRTVSYAELARTIGCPTATRAVGAANGANPIGIVIPCHRVIGSNGHLTGYGGGIDRKRWLLQHEHAQAVDGTYSLMVQ